MRFTFRSCLILGLLSGACVAGTVLPASASPSPDRISPDLELALQAATADELVPVTIVMNEQAPVDELLPIASRLSRAERRQFAMSELKFIAEATQGPILTFLQTAAAAGRAADIHSLWIANGIQARLTPKTIHDLEAFTEIKTVLWDPPVAPEAAQDITELQTPVPNRPAGTPAGASAIWWQLNYVQAPECWALGYDGDGIVVAVLDSGIDRTHPDLSTHMWNNVDEVPGNLVDDDQNGYVDDTWGWNFESNNNNPTPNGSHGTNCAGIVAGDGTNGTSTGVAPDALLMSCRVNTWAQNIAGIQYAIANGADIISMSRSEKWRFTPKPNYDWWRANTDNELLVGIFHANSIGNEGDNQGTDPIPFNIAAPGCCPSPWRHPAQVQAGVSGIVGVGAVGENNVIATYSSIGPFAWENIQAHWPIYPHSMRPEYQDYPWWGSLPGLLKPDVVAPGPNTRSVNPGGGYITFSGTSAATPHVAGAMAICLQANPNLTPEQMSMILQTTAGDLGVAGKDNTFGAGKLNCLAAVQAALDLALTGEVGGMVTDVTNSKPIQGVLVEVVGGQQSATTNGQGLYAIELPAGAFDLRFTHPNYVEGQGQITIVVGSTVTLDMALAPVATGIGSTAAAPIQPALAQNHPNPFNPATMIRFQVPGTGTATLQVFDVSGRLVRTLAQGSLPRGAHQVTWDGRDDRGFSAPTGIYVYRLDAGGKALSRRMVLLQ